MPIGPHESCLFPRAKRTSNMWPIIYVVCMKITLSFLHCARDLNTLSRTKSLSKLVVKFLKLFLKKSYRLQRLGSQTQSDNLIILKRFKQIQFSENTCFFCPLPQFGFANLLQLVVCFVSMMSGCRSKNVHFNSIHLRVPSSIMLKSKGQFTWSPKS